VQSRLSTYSLSFQISKMDWKTLAAEKKSNLEASIPTEWRIKTLPTDDSVMSFPGRSEILTREELNITESSATELVQDLASGKLSSVAVTTAFCKRGALAQQLVKPIVPWLR
jgi:amidase